MTIRSGCADGFLDEGTCLATGVVDPTQVELHRCARWPENDAEGYEGEQQGRARSPPPSPSASAACSGHNGPPLLRKTTLSLAVELAVPSGARPSSPSPDPWLCAL